MAVEAGGALRLGRVVARIARHVEVALAGLDLTSSQYRALAFLAGGPANASMLADRLAIRRPSLTAVVDTLVARGLVERQEDPGDRRRVGHRLTRAGLKSLEQADAAVERRLDELLSLVEVEDAEAARRGLDAWLKALDAFRSARQASR